MAAGDINSWRRQNSDVVALVITLQDGSALRGNIMQPRDKTLRDLFNMPDPFIDFEDSAAGDMIIAKATIRSVRKHDIPIADQLDKKLSALEKADPHRILGLGKSATGDEIHGAYLALARAYHPDRFASAGLPPEVAEYLETMTRRVNVAYSEISALVKAAPTADAASVTPPRNRPAP
jgi:DnaJ-domain-containing protein 1